MENPHERIGLGVPKAVMYPDPTTALFLLR